MSQPIFDIARLPITDPLLVGRKAELARLDKAWKDEHTGVMAVVGRGGEGKTALVNAWLATLGKRGWLENKRVYGWTFYSQGTTGAGVSLAVKKAVAPHENLFPSWTGLLLHGAARIQAGDPRARRSHPRTSGRPRARLPASGHAPARRHARPGVA